LHGYANLLKRLNTSESVNLHKCLIRLNSCRIHATRWHATHPITRLIGAVLLEQNDEWLLKHRYMQIEGMAEPTPPLIDADPAKLPPMAA
jgi:hypothetical protein